MHKHKSRDRYPKTSNKRRTSSSLARELAVLFLGLTVGGCAIDNRLAEANAKMLEIEKRVARIEDDLYKVEVKSAPLRIAEPSLVPAREVEQNVIDAKINAFLKEYLGVQFGDNIEKYPTMAVRFGREYKSDSVRAVKVLMKFKYFDQAEGCFENGKLFGIRFYVDIDKKYSVDSTNRQIDQALADLAVTFGLPADAFNGCFRLNGQTLSSSYYLSRMPDVMAAPNGFRRYGIVIEDRKLKRKYRNERNRLGEALPDAN